VFQVKHFILCIGVAVFHVKQFHGRTRITKNRAKLVQKMLNVSHNKNRAKVGCEMLNFGKVATQQKPCHKVFANVKSALGNVK
jgi:hypothetical protein